MAQEIVFYHSAMTGAPSSTLNAAGAVITVLDAVLVNGFNVNTVSTLTRSGTTATATTSGTNGFAVNDWVLIAGADQSAYNGRVKVTSKPASNQFTFEVAGSPTTPATGTITAKYPGAGWAKTTAGTNNAAYQAGAGSLGHWVQIEDNNPYADSHLSIRTRKAAGWTALDTASVVLSLQYKQLKLTGGWMVISDHKTCYMFFGAIATPGSLYSFPFGEITPFYAGDAFSDFMGIGESGVNPVLLNESGTSVGTLCPGRYWPMFQTGYGLASGIVSTLNLRGISQVGGSIASGHMHVSAGSRGSVPNIATYGYIVPQDLFIPSLADNSLPVAPIFNYEFAGGNYTARGKYRGIYWPLGGMVGGFTNSFQRLDNALVDGVTQSLLLVNTNNFAGPVGATKQLAFQVDGAWS